MSSAVLGRRTKLTFTAAAIIAALRCGVSPTACSNGFYQPFTRQNAKNIGVIIAGSDSVVRGEYFVVGAHYDHVGRSATVSLDSKRNDEIRPSADDNASGTAAVMELDLRLVAHPPRRSVVLVHFDAEELGLIGSSVFVAALPVARGRIKFMLSRHGWTFARRWPGNRQINADV